MAFPNNADSLLSFINSATNNIHEAMNSVKPKRKVNIRKFISRNVNKPQRKRLQLASKPQTKPVPAAPNSESLKNQRSCPVNANLVSYTNECHHSVNVPRTNAADVFDPEVNDVLSVLGVDEAELARQPSAPEHSSLAHQVMLAEYPYSPYSSYSDCSEGWFDSAYSSPSCCSSQYHLPPPCADLSDLVIPAYPTSNIILDQGLPVTPTIYEVLDSFGWS